METQVTLYNLGRDGCQVIKAKVEEVRRSKTRYRMIAYYDQDESVCVQRGGGWNADFRRAANGFTKADVEEVRRELRKLDVRATFDEVDAMLLHAQYVLDKRAERERAARRRSVAA